jgi:hypothetical protein
MNKAEALVLFNDYIQKYGLEPLTESEASDFVYDGMTEAQAIEAATDYLSEEHTARCENKFWKTHDWQQD